MEVKEHTADEIVKFAEQNDIENVVTHSKTPVLV